MKVVDVKSMEELIFILNALPNNYVFRGHANKAWSLSSSLERLIGDRWNSGLVNKFEDHSFNIFSSKYQIYNVNDHQPNSKLSWLSIMQHYGVPTRLLDFTTSPYVAIYFALEDYDIKEKNDLSVFTIDYSSVMQVSTQMILRNFKDQYNNIENHQDKIFDEIIDKNKLDIIWISEPKQFNSRIDRQSGTFLISGNRDKKIEDLLFSNLYDKCDITKYNIPASLYESLYALLRKMNINSKSIYGDVSGLAKSIRMELQIYSQPTIAPIAVN